jgi:hypothetical protein
MDLSKKYLPSFKQEIREKLEKLNPEKIAVLVSNEYEGFSSNGGIGTYYTTLSQKLAAAGWDVFLIYCQSKDIFGGQSKVAALKFVFSNYEVEEVLNLTTYHQAILAQVQEDFYFKYQSISSLFYVQAIASTFPNCKIYVEFPDINGFGHHPIQAKQANLLPKNCLIGTTIHGCFEWVFEANDSIIKDDWFNECCYREEHLFANTDLAFFPSYFLKYKLQSYGWKTERAKNMPYFIPIIPAKTYKNVTTELAILNLAGMTSREERTFAKDYAEKHYTGQGEIVDLGCWLGSFTVPFARGLEKNKKIGKNRIYLHAYDIFIWEKWMDSCVLCTELANKYQAGESFLDAFERQILPWKDKIKVYPGDLNKMNWDPVKTIEFLLVDAMKSWQLCNAIIRKFFPALKPNFSLIQHQDYVHYYCSWIHLIMYRFRDYFEPILYVPSSSLIFKYTKAIPESLLQKNYSFSDFSPAEINQAFNYSYDLVPQQARANIAAAKVMLYVHLGDMSQAKKELELLKETGIYSPQSELPIVENLIVC